jgi:lipid-A-disaccharide synthase
VVARAPSLDDALFAPLSAGTGPRAVLVSGATDDVLACADVAITASGTATVQTALHGTPMVIVYRVSAVTYAIGRHLVRVPQFGMVNLIAGRTVVPELIQHDYTPEQVAREVTSLLTDRARTERLRADLAAVVASLGGAGASRRVAEAVRAVATGGRSAG